MMPQSIPVVISGFGQWARNRTVIPFLKQNPGLLRIAVVTSVAEREFQESVAPLFAQNGWETPKLVVDFEEACARLSPTPGAPAAVLVTTPNGLHFREVKTALEAGYHVCVERPIVRGRDALPELVALADRRGLVFLTATQRRLEDPFQYLRHVVAEKYEFAALQRIRCRFAARHRLHDWRRDPELSGGGVVMDSGYHLLDIAAWLIDAAGIPVPERLEGMVRFDYHAGSDEAEAPVETEALGYLRLPHDVHLSFDFSYNAPADSIFEQVELGDQNFTRVLLTRDQPVRTALPGTVTHQKPDGEFVHLETPRGPGIRVDGIRFAGAAQNTRPLHLFAQAIRRGLRHTPDGLTLEARRSLSTWRLVREIYRLASRDGQPK